jgi:tetratricopeptide (TPR) repeat protein
MERLDPQNPNIIRNVLFTNGALRRWPQAAAAAARFRAVAPDSVVAKIQSGYVEFQWKGDIDALEKCVADVPPEKDSDGAVAATRWDAAMLKRDFAGARKVIEASGREDFSYLPGALQPRSFFLGLTALAQNDHDRAIQELASAAPSFEQDVKEAAEAADRRANLGMLYAFMGRHDEAIREGKLAVQLKPIEKDATDGATVLCCLALIYARVGEKDLGIPLIERLLKTPGAIDSVNYSITLNDLKYRWEWDELRSDPRFQRLLSDKGAQ